ncbi:MAG: NAD(P)-dependent alcohol dehydrogenase [Bacteroidales bacterium]|nr:NAD(P)-dependent alcohol dehydrogenase [Bacteroidales bacterium]MBN2820255.1 NAD(P)-dependent alcohol dehydrogenase [Bacteroidales bacterium]
MKAITYHKYGSADVLRFEDVDVPTPGVKEVLVKVHACSINDFDWGLLRGKPFVNKAINGFRKPRRTILGSDIAGEVVETGKEVTQFQKGDKVFGDISNYWGGFAEFVCAKENLLTFKPDFLSYTEAAALPQAGVLALQGVLDKMKVSEGQHVLINGAGGGSGSFAIQLAKHLGAEVTGVDSSIKLENMLKLGADQVIDYTKQDFTKNISSYDIIIDIYGTHGILDYKRALKPGGIYKMIGGSSSTIIQTMLFGSVISLFSNKKLGIIAHKPNKNLQTLLELADTGIIKPIVDKVFKLKDTAKAFEYFGNGLTMGKVVIDISGEN